MKLEYEALLLGAGLWAGTQNALAGGGSFVTIPALMLAGLDAKAANITSTLALYPGQVATGLAGRKLVSGAQDLPFRMMCAIGAVGGGIGALVLIVTPSAAFEALLPWLVLFATLLFAASAFRRKAPRDGQASRSMPVAAGIALQLAISIYGGYFGGGLGFMMVAALSLMGMATRSASATKNALAAVINTTSLLIFVFSPAVAWFAAGLLAVGAVMGGLAGAWLLRRIPERMLQLAVVAIGTALTVGLFVRH